MQIRCHNSTNHLVVDNYSEVSLLQTELNWTYLYCHTVLILHKPWLHADITPALTWLVDDFFIDKTVICVKNPGIELKAGWKWPPL